jgi:hypothetical protein
MLSERRKLLVFRLWHRGGPLGGEGEMEEMVLSSRWERDK